MLGDEKNIPGNPAKNYTEIQIPFSNVLRNGAPKCERQSQSQEPEALSEESLTEDLLPAELSDQQEDSNVPPSPPLAITHGFLLAPQAPLPAATMVRVDRSAWNHNVRAIARTYGASYGMGLTLREIELTAVTDINAASGLVLASVLLLGMGMSFGAVTGEVLVSLLPRALRLFSDERVQTMQNFMASQERGHLWLRLVSFSLFLGVACALGRMEGADSYATFGRTTVLCTAICLGGLATRSDLSAQLWHA